MDADTSFTFHSAKPEEETAATTQLKFIIRTSSQPSMHGFFRKSGRKKASGV